MVGGAQSHRSRARRALLHGTDRRARPFEPRLHLRLQDGHRCHAQMEGRGVHARVARSNRDGRRHAGESRRHVAEPGHRSGRARAVSSAGTGNLERLGAFCDGVFAIAITLLILEVGVPATEAVARVGLWHELASRWPSYGAYALSFFIIGIMWANHHNIFRYIGRSNHLFVMLNIWLLMGAAFLPYPTAVLAAYLRVPDARTAAAVFYGGTLTFPPIPFNPVWRYAPSRGRVLRPDADARLVAWVSRGELFWAGLYATATVVGLFHA